MKSLFSCFGRRNVYQDVQVVPVDDDLSLMGGNEAFLFGEASLAEEVLGLCGNLDITVKSIEEQEKDNEKRNSSVVVLSGQLSYAAVSPSSSSAVSRDNSAFHLVRVLRVCLQLKEHNAIDSFSLFQAMSEMKQLVLVYPYPDGGYVAEEPDTMDLAGADRGTSGGPEVSVGGYGTKERVRDSKRSSVAALPIAAMMASLDMVLGAALEACEQGRLSDYDSVCSHVNALLKTSLRLRAYIEFTAGQILKDIWCHIVATAVKLVHRVMCRLALDHKLSSGNGSSSSKEEAHPFFSVLPISSAGKLVAILTSVSKQLVIARYACGQKCNALTILFWTVCERSTQLIHTHGKQGVAGAIASLPAHASHSRASSEARERDALLASTYHCLRSVAPSPQDLFMEVNRLLNSKRRRSGGTVALHQISPMASPAAIFADEGMGVNMCYALTGLRYLLQLALTDSSNKHMALHQHDEWVAVLCEAFMFCVQNGFLVPDAVRGDAHRRELCALAPLLAEALLLVTHDSGIPEQQSWIVVDCSRLLSSFGSACHQVRKEARKNATTSSAAQEMEQAFMATKGRVERGPIQTESPASIALGIGQEVDAMCELANGSKRWFPGKISDFDLVTCTYTIQFDDGDVGLGKLSSEVRARRRRRRPPGKTLAASATTTAVTATVRRQQNLQDNDNDKPVMTSESAAAVIQTTARVDQMSSLGDGSFDSYGARSADQTIDRSGDSGSREFLLGSIPSLKLGIAEDNTANPRLRQDVASKPKESEQQNKTPDYDHKEGEEEDFFFDIPSVFDDVDGSNMVRNNSKSTIVPTMQFDVNELRNNKSVLAGQFGSSLSSSLVEEDEDAYAGSNLGENDYDDELSVPFQQTGGADSTTTTQPDLLSERSQTTLASTFNVIGTSHEKDLRHGGGDKYPFELWRGDGSLDQELYSNALRAFSLLTVVLLKHCVHKNGAAINVAACSAQTAHAPIGTGTKASGSTMSQIPGSARSLLSMGSATATVTDQINVLYSVWHFLENLDDSSSHALRTRRHHADLIAAIARLSGRNALTLLKLITPVLSSDSPVLAAMDGRSDVERIGDGAFGSVFRVYTTHDNSDMKVSSSLSPCVVVKKVRREKSRHDTSCRVVDMFYEVMCMISLKECGCRGVCNLLNFGATDKEYFLIMENGWMDLSTWRSSLAPSTPSSDGTDGQGCSRIVLFLLIMIDILKIVDQVHAKGVIHFDLKGNNFLLRGNPLDKQWNDALVKATERSEPSGLVFLADFGESVLTSTLSTITTPGTGPATLIQRSRGTLFIQSPEMLTVNENLLHVDGAEGGTDRHARSSPLHSFCSPDEKSDVWSLGLLLVELFLGEPLFFNRQWAELVVLLCSKDGNDDLVPSLPLQPFWEIVDDLVILDTGITNQHKQQLRTALTSFLSMSLRVHAADRADLKDLRNMLLRAPGVTAVTTVSRPLTDKRSTGPDHLDSRADMSTCPPRLCADASTIVDIPSSVVHLGDDVLLIIGQVNQQALALPSSFTPAVSRNTGASTGVIDVSADVQACTNIVQSSLSQAGLDRAFQLASIRTLLGYRSNLSTSVCLMFSDRNDDAITLITSHGTDGQHNFQLARLVGPGFVAGPDMQMLKALVSEVCSQKRRLEVVLDIATSGSVVDEDGHRSYSLQRAQVLIFIACSCAHVSRHYSVVTDMLDTHAPWLKRLFASQ